MIAMCYVIRPQLTPILLALIANILSNLIFNIHFLIKDKSIDSDNASTLAMAHLHVSHSTFQIYACKFLKQIKYL
jgi:hypothetical protein